MLDIATIERLAARLDEAERSKALIPMFTRDYPEFSIEDAYAVQRETLVLDGSRLARIDYGAANALAAQLRNLAASGRGIELRDLNHLVASLLRLLGVGETARLYAHKY